jgi:LacI family transcriptional regulator
MPTIRDVARRLNLSITTVSRALDGYDDVAEETREQVIHAAREMGYTPNRAARQLRRQRTDTVGYILPADRPQFADPFFAEFIAGLGDEVAANNYDLLVSAAPAESQQEKSLYNRWIQGGKVDGMVINNTRLHDWRVQYLTAQHKPFVSLERSLDEVDFVGVEVDPQDGYAELMEHLIDQGHSRIAFIGARQELKIQHDRYTAFQHCLNQAAIALDPTLVVEGDLTAEGGYHAARRLLSALRPPTAIVCVNDLTAIGAMHAIHESGLRIGRDIAVAGFDGIADAAHTQPPLTTLDQPVYAIAQRLARLLLACIAGGKILERQIHMQPKLMIRASTGGK